VRLAAVDTDFVAGTGLGPQAHTLTWAAFLGRNLLPVTIGNIIGGSILVGTVYWFAYLRPRGAAR
jgi:formate/nitrite transporter FocA (FNT family)